MLSKVPSPMFMFQILVNHLINVRKCVINQKIHVKAWNFECEMDTQSVK
jgi:hypothetical protein